jgi:hypothetical protein
MSDPFPYSTLVQVADSLLDRFGRTVKLFKFERTPVNAGQPWNGPATFNSSSPPVGCLIENVKAAFVGDGANLISRGASDTAQQLTGDLRKSRSTGFLVSGSVSQDLRAFDAVEDGGKLYRITKVNTLQPGDTILLYGIEVEA